MGAVNFYLKKAEKASGRSLIYLQFKFNGKKLVYSFGQTVNPGDWNAKKQRVKSNRQTTEDGKFSLNDLLDNLVKVCSQAYNAEIKNGIPLPTTLKRHLDNFINQNKEEDKPASPTLYSLIGRFIDGEIKKKGNKPKSQNTLDNYKATLLHLQAFEREKKYPIDFDTITLDFFYSYTDFLAKGYTHTTKTGKTVKIALENNTIAKDIVFLKGFMNKAVRLGYTTNLQFKLDEFFVSEEETDAVYLKEKELIDLYNFDLSSHPKLEQVKDLFVFGAFVGLRFSDYSNIKPENIMEDESDLFIRMNTEKTGEQVIIPCNPIVLQIFDKYEHNPNRLPKAISNQKFNDYIKDVCKQAGLTMTGRLASDPKKELWECISSHTARRSFATNLYLDGYPHIEIMKITGHKSERSFMKYIRVSKLDAAKRLNSHMRKKWSEKILKVA